MSEDETVFLRNELAIAKREVAAWMAEREVFIRDIDTTRNERDIAQAWVKKYDAMAVAGLIVRAETAEAEVARLKTGECACSTPDFIGYAGEPEHWRCLLCGLQPSVTDTIHVRLFKRKLS